MIHVIFEPGEYRMSMEGHAGAGAFGEDPVCAAASMLMYTLTCNLTGRKSQAAWRPEIRSEEGRYEAQCRPVEMGGVCLLVMRVIANGLRMLSESYPEYVRYEER